MSPSRSSALGSRLDIRSATGWLRDHAHAWGMWALSWVRPAVVFYVGGPEPLKAFESWCSAHPGLAVRLVVSGHLTHQMIVKAPMESAGMPASQEWTRHYGDDARDWPLVTWRAKGVEGSCVLYGADLAGLRRCADAHGVRLLGMVPMWASLLPWMDDREPQWCRSIGVAPQNSQAAGVAIPQDAEPYITAVLAVVEGALLTWVECDKTGLYAVLQRRLAQPTWAALAEKLDAMCHPGQRVCVVGFGLEDVRDANLGGQTQNWKAFTALDSSVMPGSVLQNLFTKVNRRWPQPDLLRAPGDIGTWGRVAVCMAWLALGVAGALFIPSRDAAEHARLALKEAQVGLQSAQAAYGAATDGKVKGTAAQSGRGASGADALAVLRVQARKISAGLHQAWGAVLLPIESASKLNVRWLELDYATEGQRLRLVGQSDDTEAALDSVQELSIRPGWSQVVLSKIQEGVGRDPAMNLRFELTAAYRHPSPQTPDAPGR